MNHLRVCKHLESFRERWKIIKAEYARTGKYEKLVDMQYCRNCGSVRFPGEQWIYPEKLLLLLRGRRK
jgi:uncharacterized OB-fold protein